MKNYSDFMHLRRFWGLTAALAVLFAMPARPATPVYAGGVHGVFASTDGGATWTHLLSNVIIASLAIDPADSQVIYAGAANAIYKTNDGGNHWHQLTKGLESAGVVTTIQIDPTSTNILYVGTGSFGTGVYKSHNNGNKWDPVNNGLTSNCGGCLDVQSLAIDPLHPNTLYVTGHTGFISSKTTDGGATWTSVDFPGAFGSAVVVNPVQDQTVFMGGPFGLWKSTSGGVSGSWTPSGPFNLGNPVQALALDPSNPATIFVGNAGCAAPLTIPPTTCYNEIYVSGDNGNNWLAVGALAPPSPSYEQVQMLYPIDPQPYGSGCVDSMSSVNFAIPDFCSLISDLSGARAGRVSPAIHAALIVDEWRRSPHQNWSAIR